ncbi:MAG: PIN domain-containing protein [Candidatus Delongbacteria bacterium]|nr:PIN domain-containing protein [Candidatus Delongbacteria bacterium]
MILLDTDVCIEILRGNEIVIEKRSYCEEKVAISFMTIAELFYGAERSNYRSKNINLIEEFILTVDIINTDVEILKKFGELKSDLYKNNILLPDADILIASTALINCSKLITGNIKHFNRFRDLSIENWIK